MKLSGTIKAPDGPSAWTSEIGRWIAFGNITGLNINGRGLFDGNGQKWWDQSCKHHPGKDCSERAPTNLLHLEILLLILSQEKALVAGNYSQDVHFKSLIINSPETSPNTDGIHIAHSHDVSVHTSVIAAGDDCISISDQTSNISVTYVNCGPGHGISIGSLGKNGEEVKVENITVRHVNFYKTTNGARIKTWQGASYDGAMVQAGIPDFWLIAIISHHVLDQEITKHDEGAVNFLTDIGLGLMILSWKRHIKAALKYFYHEDLDKDEDKGKKKSSPVDAQG
ncbi:Pectin lyase-like superfamily protein [Citrus sinensis]|uniref:Pectin lyase-like superfamily protein n=1 Tax=Citrus sinensis TaxID=2711 RepID=A0ACB8JBF8_CITSI|nr:Pectin lyase-like superfamily protein [Citrus sinensis]